MKILLQESVNQSVPVVFKGFDQKLFEALTPRPLRKKMMRFDGCKVGDKLEISMATGTWIGVITERVETDKESYFVDVGEKLPFPFKKWRHRHIVRRGESKTLIIDDIEYHTFFIGVDLLLFAPLWVFFKLRHPVYRSYFSGDKK
ncbi:MAG: hypothetical protein K2P81_13610 [Bacteriovoracaceae bacterium]|nr:hypothetical protein [Bacteriovoracaceae bacterium]